MPAKKQTPRPAVEKAAGSSLDLPLKKWTREELSDPDNWDFSRLNPWLEDSAPMHNVYDSLDQIYQREIRRELGARLSSGLPKATVPAPSQTEPTAYFDWQATKVRKFRYSPQSATEFKGECHSIGRQEFDWTLQLTIRIDAGAPRKELINSFTKMIDSDEFKGLPFDGRRKAGRKKRRDHVCAFRDLFAYRHLTAGFTKEESLHRLSQLNPGSSFDWNNPVDWTHVRSRVEHRIRAYLSRLQNIRSIQPRWADWLVRLDAEWLTISGW